METRPLLRATGVAILLAWVVAAASPQAAFAHANYDSSTPGKGEQLTVAPAAVEITFTQEVQKIDGTYAIEVNEDRGLSVTAGPTVVDDDNRMMMSVPLQPNLEDGRYVVRWKNVSDADGDATEGAFSFYLNYEPNAVDLANDADLESVGPEETPAADATPAPGETPTDPTPDSTADGGEPTAIATPDSGAGDDADDGDDGTIWVIIGAIAIGLAAGVGAFLFARSRRG